MTILAWFLPLAQDHGIGLVAARRAWRLRLARCLLTALSITLSTAVVASPETWALRNGQWFDGESFQPMTLYVDDGVFTDEAPAEPDHVLDLAGGFVVPPFGDAHSHNVESSYLLDRQIETYLEHGIYYVKVLNSIRERTRAIRDRLDLPSSIDVAFAHGGLTASGGHPIKLYEEVLREHAYRGVAKEWFRGRSYFIVDREEDLERQWEAIRATPPDFIKVFLLYSEEFELRRDDPAYFGRKGLDPRLLALVVERAHRAGLRVSAHVETANDFHHAVRAGVDEISHLPGYNIPASRPVEAYRISPSDARRAAESEVSVTTTTVLSKLRFGHQSADWLERVQENQRHNLRLLQQAGVRLALGADAWGHTARDEALHLHEMKVFDNLTLLRIWCESTAQAVFPERRIGRLRPGYEASFLVLGSDPLADFLAVRDVRLRFKRGHLIHLEGTADEVDHEAR